MTKPTDESKKPKKAKDPARPTRAKAARPDLPPIGPALADLLNPAINRGEAGVGSQTGLRPPPDNSRDRRADFAAAHRARKSTPAGFGEVPQSPYRDNAELREAYRVHSPLTHAARVARERLLILAAHGDRIVPAEHPRWLEAHWNQPRTIWFSGSHLAPFGRPTIRAAIRRFLGELDVLPAV